MRSVQTDHSLITPPDGFTERITESFTEGITEGISESIMEDMLLHSEVARPFTTQIPEVDNHVINLGVLLVEHKVWETHSLETTASSVNMAIEDFQATGALQEYDFR